MLAGSSAAIVRSRVAHQLIMLGHPNVPNNQTLQWTGPALSVLVNWGRTKGDANPYFCPTAPEGRETGMDLVVAACTSFGE